MLRLLLGRRGERMARRHLVSAGYRIVGANYHAPRGELDLVARRGDELLFVEVKTRKTHGDRLPASVPPAKQAAIVHAARHFVQVRGLSECRGRFDVILVDLSVRPTALTWIEGAFEAPAAD